MVCGLLFQQWKYGGAFEAVVVDAFAIESQGSK
jgi:hypothetical protein